MIVTDGISRPMATDVKEEERSPMNFLSHERRKSTKYFVASGAELMRCEQDDNLSAMEGEEVRIYWSLKTFREEVKFEESRGEDKKTSNKDDPAETKFDKRRARLMREEN